MNAFLIDRSEAVQSPDGELYRLRRVRIKDGVIEIERRGVRIRAPEDAEFLLAEALPSDVVEWGVGQQLIPVETADYGGLSTLSWRDLSEHASRAPAEHRVAQVGPARRRWDFQSWGSRKEERPNPGKETLLRRSLELVWGEPENEAAVRELVQKSLDGGLIALAKEAITAFSSDSSFDMYIAIQRLYEEPGYWPFIDEKLARYCELRVLAGQEARSGMYIGDHAPDQRSETLGQLGRFRYFTGDVARALELWRAGGDHRDVDAVIAKAAQDIGEHAPNRLAEAIQLLDVIRSTKIRAKALATLSEYA